MADGWCLRYNACSIQELEGVQEAYNYPGITFSSKMSAVMRDYFDIFSAEHIHHSLFPRNESGKRSGETACLSQLGLLGTNRLIVSAFVVLSSAFSFTRFSDLSPAELGWMARNGPLERWAVHMSHTPRRQQSLRAIYAHDAPSLFPNARVAEQARSNRITVNAAIPASLLGRVHQDVSLVHSL